MAENALPGAKRSLRKEKMPGTKQETGKPGISASLSPSLSGYGIDDVIHPGVGEHGKEVPEDRTVVPCGWLKVSISHWVL